MKLHRNKQNLAAFTLLELLVVIAIMGILAGIAVPTFKNISKGHATASAARQMLDDIARARQLAIAHRTTVYMVFVPLNFWNDASYAGNTAAWAKLLSPLPPAVGSIEMEKARTLLDRQAAAYTFISLRSVGDQPGRNTMQYLSPWRTLPEGMFIQAGKFSDPANPANSFTITDPVSGDSFNIVPFPINNVFRFPSEESPLTGLASLKLPYIAFNYLGQLESGRDEFIPLAKGNVTHPRDFSSTSVATENPPGNSTNAYTLVHIDRITGRARIEQPQIR